MTASRLGEMLPAVRAASASRVSIEELSKSISSGGILFGFLLAPWLLVGRWRWGSVWAGGTSSRWIGWVYLTNVRIAEDQAASKGNSNQPGANFRAESGGSNDRRITRHKSAGNGPAHRNWIHRLRRPNGQAANDGTCRNKRCGGSYERTCTHRRRACTKKTQLRHGLALRRESKGIIEIDPVAAGESIEVRSPRQPNGVFLREVIPLRVNPQFARAKSRCVFL